LKRTFTLWVRSVSFCLLYKIPLGKITSVVSITTQQIKKALEVRRYIVDERIGQSNFKCNLAIKKKSEDTNYCLGVLIDDEFHYRNNDLTEQYYQRPSILKSFGWKIMNVFAKDWLEDSTRVLNSIIKQIEQGTDFKEPTDNESSFLNEEMVKNENDLIFKLLKSADGEKFWEIAQDKEQLHIRFGKTGSKGQVLIKTFMNEKEADFAKEILIEEQINLGFSKIN
jgi:predicted DNA-binding WGR domain protein/very-short-patch-repair endonuclease